MPNHPREPPGFTLSLPLQFHHSLQDRAYLLETHPVRERRYRIPTIALDRVYAIVRERVWTCRTGTFFYGTPRTGKSTAVTDIHERLAEEFPRVYINRVNARSSGRPSMSHIYRLILESREHVLSTRKNPDLLYNNVLTDTLMGVGSLRGSQFVLLIDEMQLLSSTDIQQLLVLHNGLEQKKIKMSTISFAQPEIMHRRSAMITARERQLIARFLNEPIVFEGCGAIEELLHILKIYDTGSEFPEGSGWSYTAFFVPEAFKHGFRLEKYVEKLWASLLKAACALEDGRIPMEHLFLSVESCLLAAFNEDTANFTLSDQDINAAVQKANLDLFGAIMQS